MKSQEKTRVNGNQGAEVGVVLEMDSGVVSVAVLVVDSVAVSAMVLQSGVVLVVASEVRVVLRHHSDLAHHSVDPLHHIALKGEIGSTNMIASQEICLYGMTFLRLDMEGWMIGVQDLVVVEGMNLFEDMKCQKTTMEVVVVVTVPVDMVGCNEDQCHHLGDRRLPGSKRDDLHQEGRLRDVDVAAEEGEGVVVATD